MPAPQSAHEKLSVADGSYGLPSFFSPGSCPCTLKMMFELGKKIPRINCARFALGGGTATACDATGDNAAAGDAAAGASTTCFSASSPSGSAACPAGKFPTCS